MEMDRKLSLILTSPHRYRRNEPPIKRDMDSGWAWIVLSATFVSFFTGCGLGYNIGIYFVCFLNAFQESRAYTAWINAVYATVFQISGPISSLLLPYIGARWILICGGILMAINFGFLSMTTSVLQVIILQGIIGGIGNLLVISGSVAAITQYFNKRMYIASGIMFSGGGIGITFLGLLIEFLIEFYGWRGSLIILSGISLQFCVCGALVYNNTVERPRHPEVINLMNGETVKTEKPSKMTTAGDDHHTTLLKQKTFFRDINFWLIVGAFTFMQMSSSSIYFFFKDILIYKGLGPTFKLFITCIGVTSTVGRLCAGLLTSYITPSLFYFVIGNICALALLMLAFIDDHWSVIAIACVFGVCHGMMCVLQSLKIAHAFGKEQMPIVWGYAMGLAGIGVLVGPPLGGFIADQTRSYDGSIWLFSMSFFASATISLFIYLVGRQKSKKLGHGLQVDGLNDSKPPSKIADDGFRPSSS